MFNIADYIPYGHENAIRRETLCEKTGIPDRAMRKILEELKKDEHAPVILNLSDGAGYFKPILPEEENLIRRVVIAELGRKRAAEKSINKCMSVLGGSVDEL